MVAASKQNALTLFLRHAIGISFSDHILLWILGFASRCGVTFVSDSDLLAENLGPRIGCEIKVVPIPLALPKNPAPRQNVQPLCSYFGARRKSKGFHLLPVLVTAALKANPDFHFAIQAYMHRDAAPESEVTEALQSLKLLKNTALIDHVLDDKTFTGLVFRTDIALIPCDPRTYQLSTSGIFVMSVVARSVVVTTERTWMAHQAQKYKMTRVVLMPWQATQDQIETAMQKAMSLLQQADKPSGEEKIWCSQQTPKGLWNALLHE
jgi:hypothetical protein